MAISGLVLVLFVLGHMLGNLQFFLDPYYINLYAYKLKSLGPALWVIRLSLLLFVTIHIWSAVMLTIENRRARPNTYVNQDVSSASFASRTMRWSGVILLSFIVYHILHYTALVTNPEYANMKTTIAGVEGLHHNVHAMMIAGFQNPFISGFYILSTALLCLHLAHGVSSMFQSIGWRNERWRYRLDKLAWAYGIVVFVGFAVIPLAVLGGYGS